MKSKGVAAVRVSAKRREFLMPTDVFALSGEYAITTEDGQKLFEIIQPEIAEGKRVELNFSGVRVFASPFFNAAIGPLLEGRSSDDLRRLIKFNNLSPIGESVINRVIENSDQYYRNPEARKALDAILGSDDPDVGENGPS